MPYTSFDKEPAYILHCRPYDDNSRIVEFLTLNHGRITAFCKLSSTKPAKLLQPFTPMLITCGTGENLFSLYMFEAQERCLLQEPKLLLLALYVNEIVTRLVPKDMNTAGLFSLYVQVIKELSEHGEHEKILRIFELALLKIIGHGPQLAEEISNHQPVIAQALYSYKPGVGPVPSNGKNQQNVPLYHGETLLAMDANFENYSDEILREARTLMRSLISYHLSGRELYTRGIFEYLKQQES